MNVVVLVSGGLDSVTALHDAVTAHGVRAGLSFRYGAKHNAREIPMAAWHCERLGVTHRVFDLGFVEREFASALLTSGGDVPDGHYAEASMRQTVVPFRNGILLAAATGFAESIAAGGVVIAAHGGDHAIYPDCRPRFMDRFDEAMREGTYARIRLLRPFIEMDKAAIVRRGAELGVDFSRTWSCYRGGALHCGTCGTCVERREAFIRAGVPDPTAYARLDPLPPAPEAQRP